MFNLGGVTCPECAAAAVAKRPEHHGPLVRLIETLEELPEDHPDLVAIRARRAEERRVREVAKLPIGQGAGSTRPGVRRGQSGVML